MMETNSILTDVMPLVRLKTDGTALEILVLRSVEIFTE